MTSSGAKPFGSGNTSESAAFQKQNSRRVTRQSGLRANFCPRICAWTTADSAPPAWWITAFEHDAHVIALPRSRRRSTNVSPAYTGGSSHCFLCGCVCVCVCFLLASGVLFVCWLLFWLVAWLLGCLAVWLCVAFRRKPPIQISTTVFRATGAGLI